MKLTPTEYKIMDFLMTNAGIVFSAEKIYENVWEQPAYSVENTVMVHIRRIREKIEINPKDPKYLKVVWGGIGYKIEKKSSREPLAKFIAFILTIIFIIIITLQIVYIEYANLNLESIVEKEYKNSKAFENEVNMAINDVYNLLNSGGNKKNRK